MIDIPHQRRRSYLRTCRFLAVVSTVLALAYLKWLLFDARPETMWLYRLLVAAEAFNIFQATGFWITISRQTWSEPEPPHQDERDSVDVFITVRGEPITVVEHTLRAAMAMRYENKRVFVLDDGDSEQVALLAEKYGATHVTRYSHEGAKAGNLNHALSMTGGTFVAVFDADHAPYPDFLDATLGAFRDPAIGFVQTPQVYRNRGTNRVAAGAHDQQGIFYGPIMRGKNGMRAVFCCGTNVVYRRSALAAIGGIPEDSITEDLRTTLKLLRAGYSSVYISRVLAEGLGPLDVGSYLMQQYRWNRGGLDVMLRRRPFFRRMKPGQILQFSLGFLYWFTGFAYVAYLILPIAFLTAGLKPIHVPNDYPAHFLPYVTAALFTIVYATDLELTFSALWFTLASFPVHVRSLLAAILSGKAGFVVTPKSASNSSLAWVLPHMAMIVLLVAAAARGIAVMGPQPSVLNNVAWVIGHVVVLSGFIRLSLRPEATTND